MARPAGWRTSRPAALLVALLSLVTACTGQRPTLADEPTPAPAPTSTTTEAPVTSADEVLAAGSTLIATARGTSIDVYADETATEPVRTLTEPEVVTVPGATPIVFMAERRSGDRLLVQLPVRPNGSTGWVDLDDVELSRTDMRIEVRLSEHRIIVRDGDEVVFEEPVGVGRQDRPTPGGTYYIKELLQPPDPNGLYGTYAYGLSGFSTVLESFNGGAGVIGIHGTNEPHLVGQDVSSGCIRLTNDAISRLVEQVGIPLGTPVDIVA